MGNTSGMALTIEDRYTDLSNREHIQHNIGGTELARMRQILHVLEAFNGRYMMFLDRIPPYSAASITYTLTWNRTLLNDVYERFKSSAYMAIALQTRLASALELIDLDIDPDTFELSFNFDRVKEYFQNAMAIDLVAGMRDMVDFFRGLDLYYGNDIGFTGFQATYEVINELPMTPELQSLINECPEPQ